MYIRSVEEIFTQEKRVKTMKEVRDYLKQEQAIASDPGTPEWQVFTTLSQLADRCTSVEQFVQQAQALPLEGPDAEVAEARQWLGIALDTIAGQ